MNLDEVLPLKVDGEESDDSAAFPYMARSHEGLASQCPDATMAKCVSA